MYIQTEYTWYTTPKYQYWFRAILGRFSIKIPSETWTHFQSRIFVKKILCKAPNITVTQISGYISIIASKKIIAGRLLGLCELKSIVLLRITFIVCKLDFRFTKTCQCLCHFVGNSIIFSGKVMQRTKWALKTSSTHIFPIFAGWSGERGSFF